MKAQQRFAVFVKALGVWALATGLGTLPLAAYWLGVFSDPKDPKDLLYMVLGSIIAPALFCLCGCWLIRSNWIIRIAYSRGPMPAFAADHADTATTLATFSAILKTLGVWYLLQGIMSIPLGVDNMHGGKLTAWLLTLKAEVLVTPAIAIAYGGLLFVGTNWFIKWGFPELVAAGDGQKLNDSNQTVGDCPNFSESARKNETVLLSRKR